MQPEIAFTRDIYNLSPIFFGEKNKTKALLNPGMNKI